MYLVDTSVWIDFLRGTPHPSTSLLEEILRSGDAALCDVVFAEVCWGAKDTRQFEKYASYFGDIPFLHLPSGVHHEMAQMGFALRNKGYKPFIADLMIALTALTNRAPLLTNDKDFEPYHDLFGLVLASMET